MTLLAYFACLHYAEQYGRHIYMRKSLGPEAILPLRNRTYEAVL